MPAAAASCAAVTHSSSFWLWYPYDEKEDDEDDDDDDDDGDDDDDDEEEDAETKLRGSAASKHDPKSSLRASSMLREARIRRACSHCDDAQQCHTAHACSSAACLSVLLVFPYRRSLILGRRSCIGCSFAASEEVAVGIGGSYPLTLFGARDNRSSS